MLRRFWEWLTTWSKPKDDLAVWSPQEREIYTYFDGTKLVKGDPQLLYRAMMEVGAELSVDIAVASSPSKDWRQAEDNAAKKIRGIFNLKPLEEGGLSTPELANLLKHFWSYCESVKKAESPSRTSSASTVAQTPTSEDAKSPIAPGSPSGSIASAASTAVPVLSPMEPELPSAPSKLLKTTT